MSQTITQICEPPLKAADLAHAMNVSVAQIKRLARAGKIPGMIRVGAKAIRFRRAEAEDFVRNGLKEFEPTTAA